MSGVKEECGVFGIYDLDGGNIAPSVLSVLYIFVTGQKASFASITYSDR